MKKPYRQLQVMTQNAVGYITSIGHRSQRSGHTQISQSDTCPFAQVEQTRPRISLRMPNPHLLAHLRSSYINHLVDSVAITPPRSLGILCASGHG